MKEVRRFRNGVDEFFFDSAKMNNALTRKIYDLKHGGQDHKEDPHPHDPRFYTEVDKRLGLLELSHLRESEFEHEYFGLPFEEGDTVLELSLDPLKDSDKRRNRIIASMGLVTEYISANDLHPRYVVALTYERLAEVTRSLGFTISDIPVPDNIAEDMKRGQDYWIRMGYIKKPPGKPVFIYQTTGDFMQRFGGLSAFDLRPRALNSSSKIATQRAK